METSGISNQDPSPDNMNELEKKLCMGSHDICAEDKKLKGCSRSHLWAPKA